MHKAIFIDRDGVINEDIGYIYRIEDIKIPKDVPQSLKKFKEMGFLLIVISNQPVIARGLATEEMIKNMNKEINNKIKTKSGVFIDRFYFCPHHPNANVEAYRKLCECRKPGTGMILQAAKDFDIDLKNSYMVGDRISDIIAGKNAGCTTFLVESKYNHKKIEGNDYDMNTKPDFIINNLNDVIDLIR